MAPAEYPAKTNVPTQVFHSVDVTSANGKSKGKSLRSLHEQLLETPCGTLRRSVIVIYNKSGSCLVDFLSPHEAQLGLSGMKDI